MVLDWKITNNETEANASAANGFLKLRISCLIFFKGFVITVNDRDLKFRPATMCAAIKVVDAMMRGTVGDLLAAMEPVKS